MSSDAGPPNRPALTSWKEIAQYFEREVRTVQRWEREGLPVHRHMHRRQSSVYAYADELETWWRERGAGLQQDEPGVEGVAAGPVPPSLPWKGVAVFGVLALAVVAVVAAVNQGTSSRAAALPMIQLEMKNDTPYPPSGPFTGDVNGDGAPDIIISDGGRNEAYIVFGGSLPAASRPLSEAANVVLSGMERGVWNVSAAGDFNGDGLTDLLFSQILHEPEAYRATGPQYVVFGRREWPRSLRLPEEADVKLTLKWNTDARLNGCPSPGPVDLNRDGITDLVLAAQEYGPPDRVSAGAVFVLHGREKWPRELEVASAADVTILGSRTGEGLVGGCAAGDFNGDGHTDLAVGAGESTLWNLLGAKGRMYVFTGGKTWPRRLDAAKDFHLRIDGTVPGNHWSNVVFADVNGDGSDDLLFSRPWGNGPERTGDLLVFYSGRERERVVTENDADVFLRGPARGNQLGAGLTAADLDGDGCADVVISESVSGRVFLLRGCEEWPARGSIDTTKPLELARGRRGSGYWRIALEDLDRDFFPELIMVTWLNGPDPPAVAGPAIITRIHHRATVDVRPEKDPNVVLLPGVVVARIHGFSTDDAEQIDPATLRLAGAGPTHTVVADYNGDGIPDVQAQFDTIKMRITLESSRAQMIGRTRSGRLVGGADSIVVMPIGASPPPVDAAAKRRSGQ